jgi:hypothetical protein
MIDTSRIRITAARRQDLVAGLDVFAAHDRHV